MGWAAGWIVCGAGGRVECVWVGQPGAAGWIVCGAGGRYELCLQRKRSRDLASTLRLELGTFDRYDG